MRLLKRITATAVAIMISMALLPLLFIGLVVSTWRASGLVQRLRERMPIDGEYQRESVVLRPVPVEVKEQHK